MHTRFYRNVVLKALLLLVILNLLLAFLPPSTGKDQLSLYNNLVPGRERFPFGEAPQQAYNLSLYDLDAMFSAHEVSARSGEKSEFRVFVLGDSSVWGTLLKPAETLAGRLNAVGLTCNDLPVKFYNLGYPTISLTKDLMVLQRAMRYQPDLILWLTTLEAFPLEKQLASPLALNNPERIQPLVEQYSLPLEVKPLQQDFWSRTLWGQRRAIADWLRLQAYGVMWAATGVDQYYGEYEPAAWDLAANQNYYDFTPPTCRRTAVAGTPSRPGSGRRDATVDRQRTDHDQCWRKQRYTLQLLLPAGHTISTAQSCQSAPSSSLSPPSTPGTGSTHTNSPTPPSTSRQKGSRNLPIG